VLWCYMIYDMIFMVLYDMVWYDIILYYNIMGPQIYMCDKRITPLCLSRGIPVAAHRITPSPLYFKLQVEHKIFPWFQTFITRKLLYVEYNFFFQNVTQEAFLKHISTLQHVLLLLLGERLIDNQFLSTCSPTCLQLL